MAPGHWVNVDARVGGGFRNDARKPFRAFITSEEAQIAAEEYIDGLIKLPKWLEFADDIIIRGAIKTVVAYYNGKYGNDWDVGTKEKAKKFIEENIKARSEGK